MPCTLIDSPVAPPGLARLASLADEAWTFHRLMRGYAPTPVVSLDSLATELGLGSLLLKDESHRFGLNAFKVLGPSFAIHRWLARNPPSADVTFTTATDGNHGRAVAWVARQQGHRAVIFMPAHSVPARIQNIENEGAAVVLVEEGYDAAVELAHRAAHQHGWILIQDMASPGYEEIPEWLAAGYWTMARELEPWPNAPGDPAVDLVVTHAGVGTWPAAMTAYFWNRYGSRRPHLLVVEPAEADCVLASVNAGRPVHATGSLQTIMAGLNCGFPSTTAFEILRNSVDAFLSIPDIWAERAMRRLATPVAGDPMVIAGESGAASVAALLALKADDSLAPLRKHLGLSAPSRVLVWSTEGATDPEGWERVVSRK